MELATRAKELDWYHTIELAPGVLTDGVFDLRPYVPRYGLPENMEGMRVLEVGTFDGFWSFEMERRGADVVAIDVQDDRDFDWPAVRRPKEFTERPQGACFEIAHEALGSNVDRRVCAVYEATPEELGTFDLVFCGSVLIHLRDPVLALERIGALCHDRFITVEPYSRLLGLVPTAAARYRALRPVSVVFWEPNLRAWREMLMTAGFTKIERLDRFDLKATAGWKVHHAVHHATK